MTKRDFAILAVAPIVLLAIAAHLLWFAADLREGSERRFAQQTVLQTRAAADGVSQASGRAIATLSRLAAAAHEADAATVTVATSLAALLVSLSLFQILTLVRLLRSQRKPTSHRQPEIAAGAGASIRPPSSVTARSALSGAIDQTIR